MTFPTLSHLLFSLRFASLMRLTVSIPHLWVASGGLGILLLVAPVVFAQPALPQPAASAPAPLVEPIPPPPSPTPTPTYKDGVVKVGSELKKSVGRVTDVEKGDNGCYLTLKDEKNIEFIEIGTFDLCSIRPSLKGQRVELAYKLETIAASSCYGDPKCKKMETVPLVVKVNVLK